MSYDEEFSVQPREIKMSVLQMGIARNSVLYEMSTIDKKLHDLEQRKIELKQVSDHFARQISVIEKTKGLDLGLSDLE